MFDANLLEIPTRMNFLGVDKLGTRLLVTTVPLLRRAENRCEALAKGPSSLNSVKQRRLLPHFKKINWPDTNLLSLYSISKLLLSNDVCDYVEYITGEMPVHKQLDQIWALKIIKQSGSSIMWTIKILNTWKPTMDLHLSVHTREHPRVLQM